MSDFDFEFDDMPVRYPVGEHSFRELHRRGCLYVDKTYYVARLISQGKFFFLSRPRRFGKSLLLSTIECYLRHHAERALSSFQRGHRGSLFSAQREPRRYH